MASTIVNFESHTATMQQNIDGILASVDNLTRVKELVDTYRLVRKVMIFLIIAAAFILISMILGSSITGICLSRTMICAVCFALIRGLV